jgi:hypothetical protein
MIRRLQIDLTENFWPSGKGDCQLTLSKSLDEVAAFFQAPIWVDKGDIEFVLLFHEELGFLSIMSEPKFQELNGMQGLCDIIWDFELGEHVKVKVLDLFPDHTWFEKKTYGNFISSLTQN